MRYRNNVYSKSRMLAHPELSAVIDKGIKTEKPH